MAVQQEPRITSSMQIPAQRAARTAPEHGAVMTPTAAKTFAVVRIVTGFVFLWAFLDKTFGWHYATPAGKGWVDGGSPTQGFLSGVAVGPLESVFHEWAGNAWIDWLFMLGLLGIGLALLSGVALRLTALAGTLMMALMWAAEWPLAQHLSDGAPSMSTNPVADYHLLYALVLIALAAGYAGNTWGLGRVWARLPFVHRHPWLL
ncbi:DoxX family membrane protein [Streptomyces lycii]|uniref:DoxX family membrane protein n=1 Tax=Streptomyces lycii TaxID=2654337 RepID=A0ABQ7F926_9ACTN|nr:DoxX family membrane protein [Streptomyces lycii]KAF4405311.1 DoxX family membrane protein [Streptomyces lycii]